MALIQDKEDYLMFYGEDDQINKVARINRKKFLETMDKVEDFDE